MIRVLALLWLLVAIFAPQGADARAQHPPVSSLCSFGAAVPDGCGQSAEVQFGTPSALIHPNFYTGYANSMAGTATDYSSVRPKTNMSCIDYHCGAYIALSAAADPVASPPTGCTSSTGPYGNPRLTCTGATFAGLVSGYNFGAAFGHGCTSLYINPTGIIVSKVSITNNYFTNDGNCGFAEFSEFMVNTGSFTFETDFTFNTFQGNGTTFPYNTCNGTADGNVTCNGAAALNTYGIVKIQYNSFVNFAARPIYCNFGGGGLTNVSFKYNYVEGWDYHPFNGHTEFMVCNGNGNAGMDAEYNTIIQTTNAMQFGPSPFWLASTYFVDYINGINLTGNTIIGSLVGNAAYTATTSGCVGATSACNTPGSNFYVSTTSANIGTGEELGGAQGGAQCQTPSGTATVASISAPSGGLSTMVVTGTPTVALEVGGSFTLGAYGANTMTIKSITTGIGAAGTYVINNSNTGSYTGPGTATIAAWEVFAWISANISGGKGNGSSWTLDSSTLPPGLHLEGPATCSGMTMWAPSSNTYAWQGNNVRHISSITIQGNYIDASSSWIPRDGDGNWVIFTMGGAGGQSSTGSIASGALTITGGSTSLSLGAYVFGASVPGCGAADPTTCPTIVSGSGSSWVVTPAISAPSESLTIVTQPWVCAATSVVNSNKDMAGVSSLSVNPVFSLASNSWGC